MAWLLTAVQPLNTNNTEYVQQMLEYVKRHHERPFVLHAVVLGPGLGGGGAGKKERKEERQGRRTRRIGWRTGKGEEGEGGARDDEGRRVGQRSKKDFSKSWGCPVWPGHKVGHKVTWPFRVPRGHRAVFGSGARGGE